jgi:hypothetical protein
LSLVERKWGKKIHLVFKMRGPKEIYLGPKDRPNKEKVRQALEYVDQMKQEYVKHYDGLRERLQALLKEESETP